MKYVLAVNVMNYWENILNHIIGKIEDIELEFVLIVVEKKAFKIDSGNLVIE